MLPEAWLVSDRLREVALKFWQRYVCVSVSPGSEDEHKGMAKLGEPVVVGTIVAVAGEVRGRAWLVGERVVVLGSAG